ncbi:hypothetical protein F4Y93_10785 [Candidatus Poribacteria bacterium]|nr:hypothetical protein [Candidatus Poribacteria bacterium]MYF23333.1 hypothetical protein [Chloroflexota bacterium]
MSFRYRPRVHTRPRMETDSVWVATSRISHLFCTSLPADLADLLDVAVAAYAADRKSRRSYRGPNTGRRSIELELSLRNPERWNESTASEGLGSYLHWLSGDDWTLDFHRRQTEQSAAETQASLFGPPLEAPASVSLFSGGLDSVAGLAGEVSREPDSSHVLVSGYTHTRLLAHQRRQVRRIRTALEERTTGAGSRVWHMAVGFGINRPEMRTEEKGQRTRAFVYKALGVAAATLAGTNTLRVFENGIGALNLPLNRTQIGVDNYRGVHPRSLKLLEDLLPAVVDRPVRIENPYLLHTKAEMCEALPSAGFVDVVDETVSCDRFPLRIRDGPSQCGYCTSCILRRQALHASGLGDLDPGTAYLRDAFGGYDSLSRVQRHGLLTTRDHVFQVRQALGKTDPWLSLCLTYPQLADISLEISEHRSIDHELVKQQMLRLFGAYVSEWQCLASLAA